MKKTITKTETKDVEVCDFCQVNKINHNSRQCQYCGLQCCWECRNVKRYCSNRFQHQIYLCNRCKKNVNPQLKEIEAIDKKIIQLQKERNKIDDQIRKH